MKVYGITNCDTVKKALDWFRAHNIDFEFHDLKKLGISTAKLREWNNEVGYEKFLNKKSSTWKQLDADVKENVITADDAFKLLQQNTSILKRPAIEVDGFLFFGFDKDVYSQQFIKP